MTATAHAAGATERPMPRRTHFGFLLGIQAYGLGHEECPFPPQTTAAVQWRLGWADAAEYARCADLRAQEELDAHYCPPE